jgi:two-component sensor histidine kinase
MNVRDNGVGLDEELDIFSTDSLGLKLVRNMIRNQLKGKIDVNKKGFTEFHIEFSRNLPGEEKNGKNIGRG